MKVARCHAPTMLLLCCALLCSGCASSPPSRFYALSATPACAGKETGRNTPSVAIVWVTVPELVDRPQLVVRGDGSRVDILETHRWAEPLKSALSRTLAEDLSCQLASDRVASYPQSAAASADFRVYVDVEHFDLEGSQVLLDAFWTIRAPDERLVGSGRSRWREPLQGGGYEAAVAAFSRGVDAVSRDIAGELGKHLPVKSGR